MDGNHVFLVAGEASGDLHASGLVRELADRQPGLRFSGIGGGRMQEAGVDLLHHSDQLAFMGFAEVIRHLPYLMRVMGDVRSFLSTYRPGLVVLVDYPAFNLRVAREARAVGCKVLYYISPQIWAWHEERIRELAERTDAVACVLPFEKEWYEEKQAEYGVRLDARYVGHPLVDTVVPGTAPADLRSELLLPAEAPLLALLPGSRRQEVSRLMPPMAEAVRHLRSDHPDLMPVVCMAPGIEQAVYEKAIRRAGLPIAPNIPAPAGYTADDGVHLVGGRTYDVVGAARAAAVASGTATLETGLLQIPMAIVYRLNPISWRITRSRVDVPHVGLVNLVAGRKVVPEILQGDVTGANLAAHLAPLLVEGAERSRVVEELSQVRTRLGEGGAAGRVADLAEGLLSDNRPEPLPEAT